MDQVTSIDTRVAPEPGRAGMLGLLLCTNFPMIGLFSIGVDLPRIASVFADLPYARVLAQLVGGVTGLTFALSAPLVGRLIERFGYRSVYIWSLVGLAAIGVLPALLDNLYLILACRCLLGLPVAASVTAGMAGLGTLPDAIRGRMFGRAAVLNSLGTIVFFAAAGALAAIDWHLAFLVNLFALIVLPLAFAIPKGRSAVLVSAHGVAVASRGSLGVSPGFLAIAAFVGIMMFTGPMFAPFYLASIGITDPKLASLPLASMSIASLVMTTAYGRLHDRFGTTAIFAGILILAGSGLLWAGLSSSLFLFTCGMVTTSFGLSLFVPNIGAAISAAAEGSPGRGLGLTMSAMFVVQAVFPFVSEGIRSQLGSRGVFLCFGVASLALATGFVFAARRETAERVRKPA